MNKKLNLLLVSRPGVELKLSPPPLLLCVFFFLPFNVPLMLSLFFSSYFLSDKFLKYIVWSLNDKVLA